MMKRKFTGFLLLALAMQSCQTSAPQPGNTSSEDSVSTHVDSVPELNSTEAYSQFEQLYLKGNSSEIPETVCTELFGKSSDFPGSPMFTVRTIGMADAKKSFKGFLLTNNLSNYLAVFSQDEKKELIQFVDLNPLQAGTTAFTNFYGSECLVIRSQNMQAPPFHELVIIDSLGNLIRIPKLKLNQLPPIEEDGLWTNYEIILGNRYLVMEHSTDIVGTEYVYDLEKKKFIGDFSAVSPATFSNDTLYVYGKGKFIRDSEDGLALIEKTRTSIYKGKVGNTAIVGEIISH
ncbi:MAG: hypothetical protein ACK40M_07940 [Flavobacteriales bacterium]